MSGVYVPCIHVRVTVTSCDLGLSCCIHVVFQALINSLFNDIFCKATKLVQLLGSVYCITALCCAVLEMLQGYPTLQRIHMALPAEEVEEQMKNQMEE